MLLVLAFGQEVNALDRLDRPHQDLRDQVAVQVQELSLSTQAYGKDPNAIIELEFGTGV
jgi:hypothetical protein